MANQFETLAKHFAGKLKTKIIFKEGAHPETDGETIVLPKIVDTDYVIPTLACILHEASHVKFTDFKACSFDTSSIDGMLFNLLEDIRLDNMTFKKYAGAPYMYKELLEQTFIEMKQNKSIGVSKLIDICKHIYLNGIGMEDMYWDKEYTEQFLPKYGDGLKAIFQKVAEAKTTAGLNYPVTKLKTMLKDYMDNERKEQEKSEEGQASKKKAEKEKRKELKEAKEELEQNKKEQQDLSDKISETYDKARKMNDDRPIGDPKKMAEFREELKKEQDKATGMKAAQTRRIKDQYKLEEQVEELNKVVKAMQEEDEEEADIEVDFDAEMSADDVGEIFIGFKQLQENSKFKIKREEVVDFETNMKAIFQRLDHTRVYNNSTGKINLNRLHKIFIGGDADYSDIFIQDKMEEKFNNKIIFLLDTSGSMGDANSRKMQCMIECIANMTRVIEDNSEHYNIQYEIINYSDDHVVVKSFEQPAFKNVEELRRKINYNRGGGSTNIIPAMEACYKRMEQNCHPKDKRFMIVFTDAEYGQHDIQTILKEYDAKQEKIIFIGINDKDSEQSYASYNKEFFEKILMGRMVRNVKGMEKVLIESFDRLI